MVNNKTKMPETSRPTPSLPDLPRYDYLADDLMGLKGYPDLYDPENKDDVRVYLPHEAAILTDYLAQWLPHVLGESEKDNIQQQETKVMDKVDENDIAYHQTDQIWGEIPAPEDVTSLGPIIEVAGPTDEGDYWLESYGIKPDFVSNIETENQGTPKSLELDDTVYDGQVNFFADAKHLPIAPDSVGAVIVSCLPGAMREKKPDEESGLRDKAISEAARVVKDGGFLYWSGGNQADFDKITAEGFQPVFIKSRVNIIEHKVQHEFTHPDLKIYGIFQKIPEPSEKRVV